MAQESQTSRNVWRVGFYLILAALLTAGALFVGASMLRASNEPVKGTTSPTIASAPKPVSKSVAEEIRTEEKAAQEKDEKEREKKEQAKKEREKKEQSEAREQAAAQPVRTPNPTPTPTATAEPTPAAQPVRTPNPTPTPTATAEPTPAAVPASTALYLTIPAAGRYNDPVVNSIAPSVLANGAGKLPSSGFPWQPGANTYIAGHVYGYQGTGSWQQFAGLINMTYGDEIILTDANGTDYVYQVTEILTVSPYDTWVTAPVPGKTMVTLQTCTGPGWSQRLVVRGELVTVR